VRLAPPENLIAPADFFVFDFFLFFFLFFLFFLLDKVIKV
jgi:hypothetical protein